MSNNKDFKVKNGIKPTAYQEKLGTVTSTTTLSAFQPANTWSYDSVSRGVSGQMNRTLGIAFSNDGTNMYVIGDTATKVFQYSLSTAFDISTASYFTNFNVRNEDTAQYAVNFNTNGTKMYTLGWAGDSIYQYSLSTAWNVSTASYDNVSFGVLSQSDYAYGFCFNNNGTKVYVCAADGSVLYQYSLSTAFDISTVSYDNISFSVSSQDANLRDVKFNADGTKMYIVGDAGNAVYQYSLSTAYNISTASYDNLSFSVASQATNPYGFCFNNNGTKMYIGNFGTRRIYQYSTGGLTSTTDLDLSTGSVFDVTLTGDSEFAFTNPADSGTVSQATVLLKSSGNYSLSYDSSIEFMGGSAPDMPATNEADVLTFSTRDGGTSYQASHIIDGAA